jgi:hypothetical protein
MTDTTPHIFPTLSRAKHSHLVSYPIGTEALSRALDGVPQHPMLACDFYAGNAHQRLDELAPLVLQVSYRKQANSFFHGRDAASRGVFEPRWTINVFAVGRDFRHPVKSLLLAQGLPEMVRPWLIEMASVTGKTGEGCLTLKYDHITGTLVRSTGIALLPERS